MRISAWRDDDDDEEEQTSMAREFVCLLGTVCVCSLNNLEFAAIVRFCCDVHEFHRCLRLLMSQKIIRRDRITVAHSVPFIWESFFFCLCSENRNDV